MQVVMYYVKKLILWKGAIQSKNRYFNTPPHRVYAIWGRHVIVSNLETVHLSVEHVHVNYSLQQSTKCQPPLPVMSSVLTHKRILHDSGKYILTVWYHNITPR